MAFATPTRLDHVQALRGLAAGLVMLSHLAQIEARSVADPILPASAEWGYMGVDLFFVISGFIMVHVTRGWTAGGLRRVPEFLFARAARIYPLYWIVSAVVLAVWLVRPDLVFSSSPNEPQWLNSLLLVPAEAYPLLEVGWTLVYEVMFYVAFAVLLIMPARWRPWGLAAWASIVALGYGLGAQADSALAFHAFSPLVLEFIAGAFTALLYRKLDGSRTIALVLVLAGLAGLSVWFGIGAPFEDQGPRVWRLTLPACALLLGAAWLDRHGVKAPRAAVRLGDWSYSLYLTHLLVLSAVGQVWRAAGWSGMPSVLFLAVAGASAVGAAALTYRLVEAPLIGQARHARARLFG
ncbi:MAG: acyltransferase [Pseudomonadota bacterium]